MNKWLLRAGLFLMLSPVVQASDTGSLSVNFTGLKPGAGELVVTLFRDGEHWLDGEKAYRRQLVPVSAEKVSVRFDGLESGDYGLYAFHDENANREFDMRWLPWPKPAEGAGVSNNALRSGPPRYEDARFRFDSDDMELTVEFTYY
ncbi:MAG: DUF2141 domain-containing protein [Gammaproteobacteria bacterium]|nr:DUF2141 domain-containing protein [Gammaproteobacteria bacterium]